MDSARPPAVDSAQLRPRAASVLATSAKALYWYARGVRKRTQPVSMTLGIDDVRIARAWLRTRTDWHGDDVVLDYEDAFARWNGSPFAFAFTGARKALSACIDALGLGPGDEVLVPGFTCVVVSNAFRHAGVDIRYCDIELDTYGLDVRSVESRIGERTRAILIHHLFGLVCRDYDALVALARSRGLRIIEDCAHATGARYRGRRVGNAGDVAIYSSERSKVFNTIVGGMAVTSDPALADRLRRTAHGWDLPDDAAIERQLRNVLLDYYCLRHEMSQVLCPLVTARHGWARLESTGPGELRGRLPADYCTRMSNPIAALGLNQLRKIDTTNDSRRRTAQRWNRWAIDNGYRIPVVIPDSEPVFLRYPVLVAPERKRDRTWAARELGISLGVWFLTHVHPADEVVTGCPNADVAVASCVNLPTLLP